MRAHSARVGAPHAPWRLHVLTASTPSQMRKIVQAKANEKVTCDVDPSFYLKCACAWSPTHANVHLRLRSTA